MKGGNRNKGPAHNCFKHGMTGTPTYKSWRAMKGRCSNPNIERYAIYGGRGITICDRWRDSFEAFLEDMGPRPSIHHTIDRYPDNDGNYEPGNCRWATAGEQSRNKRSNHLVIWQGEEMSVAEAAERAGADIILVRSRLCRGWSIEEAIYCPPIHARKARRAAILNDMQRRSA